MRLRPAFLSVSAALMLWIAGTLTAAAATRHVVMLFDERPELPGLAALDAEFVATLSSNSTEKIEIYREEMDRSRFEPRYQTLLGEFLRRKYADKRIDVVVAVIGPALDFLLQHGAEIFPGAAIVFCGIDRAEIGDRRLPANVRGVLVKREFAPTLELALTLHPQTRQVIVVAGTSGFDRRLLSQAQGEFQAYADRVTLTYLTDWPLRKTLTELAHLPPNSVVLFTTLFRDGAGETFVPHEAVARVSASANAPVYGFLDQYLGRGLVGGYLYSFSAHGAEAAKLVLRSLSNPESNEPQLVEPSTARMLFDWRQMQRWGISAASLPTGSEIRFREPSAWDQYRLQIMMAAAAILIEAALIFWLLHEHRYRRRAERAAREAMSELTQMNRVATAGELSATIAHEINQPLAGIVSRAHAALNWLSRENPDVGKARDALGQIITAGHRAGSIITSVRAMFGKDDARTAAIDINRLIRSVLGLVDLDLRKHGIDTQTDLAEDLPRVKGNEVQLQQVILNLVMNAIESMTAAAHRVLSIRSETVRPGMVRISIEDSGSGIDAANIDSIFKPLFTTKTRGMGMGLSICRSVMERHHGRIWVSPAPGTGSIFQFELPVIAGSTGEDIAA